MVLNSVTKPPITKQQLIDYANASLDWNKIHIDEEYAKAHGFPSVIAHGMLSMAFVGDFIRLHYPHSEYLVKKIRTRFRKVTFPGDVLTCGGEIQKETAEGVTLSLWVKNQAGEVTVDGECEITKLP